jgi:hypothetical protein
VSLDGEVVQAAAYARTLAELSRPSPDDRARLRVEVGGLPYRVLGRVAQGESTDVFLAERAQPITERVLIKALRAATDRDLLDREWETLASIHASTSAGADEVKRRIPSLVARGALRVDGRSASQATVLLAPSGFVDTFDDVVRAFPGGVDGRHAVWMWRRTLEVLAGVHALGWAHGAVLPQHLVVHARDHGVMLVGWSSAARSGARDAALVVSGVGRDCYAPARLSGAPPSAATDVTMSARCVARLLGGTADAVPAAVPRPLAELVEKHAQGRGGDDAWALRQHLGEVAHLTYGAPRYNPLPLPGWRLGGDAR